MRNQTVALGIQLSDTSNPGGLIFMKTTGDIVIDATLPLNLAIFPNIVTHGGRYESSKAQLCRESQIVVFNWYYVPEFLDIIDFIPKHI